LSVDKDSLRERVAALKHDLGKYVAWTSANLEDDAWAGPADESLLEALRADLLETRKRGDEVEAAWEVWARLTGDLPRPLDIAELVAVEEAVMTLREAEPALRARDTAALDEISADVRAAQLRIRRELSALNRRLAQE
jgi:hypothetical protein